MEIPTPSGARPNVIFFTISVYFSSICAFQKSIPSSSIRGSCASI